jgi:hypothetical protein
MRTPAAALLIVSCFAVPLSSQSTAQQIAASFTKHKHVVKEKQGVRREKYRDVQSEPTLRQDVQDYAGVYEVDELEYVIVVEVTDNGGVRATSNGRELKNARIEGGVLKAEGFEGAFLTRTDRDSPNDPGAVSYGLGVLLDTPVEFGGNTYDKLFYQLKR